jgi:hypothetical protein
MSAVACGAATANAPVSTASDPTEAVPRSAVLDRCIELSRLLPYAAATREADTMLTAWYAVRDSLDACRDEARRNSDGAIDQRLALAVLDLIGLQAAHVAADAYFLEDGMGPTCEFADAQNLLGRDLLDRVEQIRADVANTSAASTATDLYTAVDREARFFSLASGYLCYRNQPESP